MESQTLEELRKSLTILGEGREVLPLSSISKQLLNCLLTIRENTLVGAALEGPERAKEA